MTQPIAIETEQASALKLAKAAMLNAYVPYSGFSVGAVLVTQSGHFYSGCNVENAAYPEGTCAEAGAIAAMVNGGEQAIAALYVMGEGDVLVTPCGGCRQKIREFAPPSTPVHICSPDGIRQTLTIAELLPASFGPENLK